jgi:hypothetical protein
MQSMGSGAWTEYNTALSEEQKERASWFCTGPAVMK